MQRVFPFVLTAFVVLSAAACAPQARTAAQADSLVTEPALTVVPAPVFRQTGTASWFGRELHGRAAMNGAVFDMHGLSALHRTLPLGTAVVVTNLDNARTVAVSVAGRGPFDANRAIELSYGAAQELGFVEQGTAAVRIETAGPVPDDGIWTVHAASFAEEEIAKALKYRLSQRYEVVSIVSFTNNIGTFYRVRVGNYPTEEKAHRIAAKLTLEGLEPIVVRKD